MREWFMQNPVEALMYIMAIPATVVMVLQMILLLFGLGGGSGDVDADVDTDIDVGADYDADGDFVPESDANDVDGMMAGDTGLRVFTVRGVVAFFAIGGWSGITALAFGAPSWVAVVAALVMGTAALFLVALFFKWALRLQYNGTLNVQNAVGKTGEVYITVPASMQGSGKVNVIVQEKLTELDAVTHSDRALRYGEKVVVLSILDGMLVVAPKSNEEEK